MKAARSFSITIPADDGHDTPTTIEVQSHSWLWLLLQLAISDEPPFRFRTLLAGEWGSRHHSDPYTGRHELRVSAVLEDPYGEGSDRAEVFLNEIEIG